MLATLTKTRFSDPAWIFERKLDGERCLAFRRGKEVRLLSRNQKLLNHHYPEVVEALGGQPGPDLVVDGEIVAFSDGQTDFSRLQRRMQVSDPVLARPDRGCRLPLPLRHRVSGRIRPDGGATAGSQTPASCSGRFRRPAALTAHRNASGEAYFEYACRHGWEGVLAKRGDAPYVHRRSPDWLKFKCQQGQELVIGGFTEPMRSREGFGALLLGYYRGQDFVYAGKVGTGFDATTLRSLRSRLDSLEIDHPAFTAGDPPRTAHWVRPALVGEVRFSQWTPDGRLRHPSFLGLREDKQARDVVREETHVTNGGHWSGSRMRDGPRASPNIARWV